jgi:hypothetical protein
VILPVLSPRLPTVNPQRLIIHNSIIGRVRFLGTQTTWFYPWARSKQSCNIERYISL